MPWSAVLLHCWQIRWSDGGVWRGHRTGSRGEGRRLRMLTEMLGFSLEWGFSVERVMLQGAWILFYSFLHLVHQSLVVGVSWEALISEPASPLVHWFQLLPCTYVWESWHRQQGAEQAGCPPECMKIFPVSHADKYECTVWGMQWLAPLVYDSQADLYEPEMKESPRIPYIKKSILLKLNLAFTYGPSPGLSKSQTGIFLSARLETIDSNLTTSHSSQEYWTALFSGRRFWRKCHINSKW